MTTKDLVTQALREHGPVLDGPDDFQWIVCNCCEQIPWTPEHVAEAVIAAVPHWR